MNVAGRLTVGAPSRPGARVFARARANVTPCSRPGRLTSSPHLGEILSRHTWRQQSPNTASAAKAGGRSRRGGVIIHISKGDVPAVMLAETLARWRWRAPGGAVSDHLGSARAARRHTPARPPPEGFPSAPPGTPGRQYGATATYFLLRSYGRTVFCSVAMGGPSRPVQEWLSSGAMFRACRLWVGSWPRSWQHAGSSRRTGRARDAVRTQRAGRCRRDSPDDWSLSRRPCAIIVGPLSWGGLEGLESLAS